MNRVEVEVEVEVEVVHVAFLHLIAHDENNMLTHDFLIRFR